MRKLRPNIISIACFGAIFLGTSAISLNSFANTGDVVIEKEKEIIKSSKAHEYNLNLNKKSPLIYSSVIETAKLEQMEEIKQLLKKIIDNQNELIIVTARKR